MSIFLKSERKDPKVIFLLIIIYFILSAGALTMVYPFLLMISGSLKGKLDAYEFDVVPKFLVNDEVLFKRYVEHKYNEKIDEYQIANKEFVRIFKSVKPPQNLNDVIIKDWLQFENSSNIPPGFFHVGEMYYLPGASNRITTKNTRNLRNYIKNICDNNPETFKKMFQTRLPNWYFLDLSHERLLDRNYKVPKTRFAEVFYDFKKNISTNDRIYLSINGKFSKYLRSLNDYNGDINLFNEKNKTAYDSFYDITFLSIRFDSPLGFHRENFIRNELNTQFIYLSEQGNAAFIKYLKVKFSDINDLNSKLDTDFANFDDKIILSPSPFESKLSEEFANFIKNPDLCLTSYLRVNSVETLWQNFLINKYQSINNLNDVAKGNFGSFSDISMPLKSVDFKYVIDNKNKLRWNYITHNYKMVIEYLTLFGDGFKNTILYCFFAILTSLIVNPIAAYALSRYQLPSQFKILLFFIATMTFPPMVTMIPNYLLMKDIGFLNTFYALIIPGMANGYSIFLLKGFFDSLPRELYEAADIDAASELHKFWHIAMSLSKPILAVIALGAFNGAYSNFMFAVVLCPDEKMWTLMVWLVQMQAFSSRGAMMASLVLSAIPTLVVFIFAQNIILRGIVLPVEK